MLTKYLMAGVAGSLLLASTAYAAENSMTSTPATSDKAASQASMTDEASFKGDWRASKVVGLNVYNAQNEDVGSINDLLMDKSGSIKAAVISVGGFLGMGARYVAVPFDKIKFSEQPVASASASNSTVPAGGGAAKPASSTTTGSTATTSSAKATKPNPWYPDHAMLDATKDQLKNMPEFKYSTD